MGFKLYREVRDFAPPDWSSGELVVALMIADDANDDSRQSWIPLPLLCARTRLKPVGVRSALRKLSARGYEFRVSHGAGKDGRQVFAARGHAVDYVVPDMTKGVTPVTPLPVDNPQEGVIPVTPLNGERRHASDTKASLPSPKGVTPVTPLSSDLLSVSSSEEHPHDGASVEGNGLSTDQDLIDRKLRRPSKLELAAWQATQSRRDRLAAGGEPRGA